MAHKKNKDTDKFYMSDYAANKTLVQGRKLDKQDISEEIHRVAPHNSKGILPSIFSRDELVIEFNKLFSTQIR